MTARPHSTSARTQGRSTQVQDYGNSHGLHQLGAGLKVWFATAAEPGIRSLDFRSLVRTSIGAVQFRPARLGVVTLLSSRSGHKCNQLFLETLGLESVDRSSRFLHRNTEQPMLLELRRWPTLVGPLIRSYEADV